MDFTILYRVILKPYDTFKEFKERMRPEPFIIITLFVVLSTIGAYRHDVLHTNEQLSLKLSRMLLSLFFIFIFTVIYSLIILQSAKLLFKVRVRFPVLLSALMLCNLPKYLLSLPMIYLESIARYISLLGFIWVVFLWYAALSQLFPVSKGQTIALLAVLVLTSMVVSGLWSMAAIAIFNIYNPAT
jgi:Yip1 domain